MSQASVSSGGAQGSGSGPFASALRSLAIKADTKDDDGGSGANESSGVGANESSSMSRTGNSVVEGAANVVNNAPANYSVPMINDRHRDPNGDRSGGSGGGGGVPANLSKHSSNMRGEVQRGSVHSHGTDRSRNEQLGTDDRANRKKINASPLSEKVRICNFTL